MRCSGKHFTLPHKQHGQCDGTNPSQCSRESLTVGNSYSPKKLLKEFWENNDKKWKTVVFYMGKQKRKLKLKLVCPSKNQHYKKVETTIA